MPLVPVQRNNLLLRLYRRPRLVIEKDRVRVRSIAPSDLIGIINRQAELISKLTQQGKGKASRVTVIPVDISCVDFFVDCIDDLLPKQVLDILIVDRCFYLP